MTKSVTNTVQTLTCSTCRKPFPYPADEAAARAALGINPPPECWDCRVLGVAPIGLPEQHDARR